MARNLSVKGSSITPKSREVLNPYYSDVKSNKMVSPETEADITREMRIESKKSGDKINKTERYIEYRNKLVLANLRFCISIANKHQWNGVEASDINSASVEGALKAAGKFDETRGFKFITYGVNWSRSLIQKEIALNDFVQIPDNQRILSDQAKRCNQKLEVLLGRDATPEEITEQLLKDQLKKNKDKVIETKYKRREITVEKVKEALAAHVRTFSYDSPLETEGEATFIDFMGDDDKDSNADTHLIRESFKKDVYRVFNEAIKRNKANDDDVKYFREHFGFDLGPKEFTMSYEMLGNKYGKSTTAIEYRVSRLISELKNNKSLFLNYISDLC